MFNNNNNKTKVRSSRTTVW